MNTVILPATEAAQAARWLLQGKVVVFPTETVYGIGANALNAAACQSIYAIKQRSPDNPLIVHTHSIAQLLRCTRGPLPPYLGSLLHHFTPGPLTVIVPKHPAIPEVVTAGQSTVALRIPSHPVAQKMLTMCNVPVAAPSANISGKVSATTAAMATALRGKVTAIIDGGASPIGLESTIIVPTATHINIVRQGAIEKEDICTVVPDIPVRAAPEDGAVTPGTAHPHYQPSARVVLFPHQSIDTLGNLLQHNAPAQYGIILSRPTYLRLCATLVTLTQYTTQCTVVADNHEYARRLFQAFDSYDSQGCTRIWAELPNPHQRLYRSLLDRLHKAAAGSHKDG